MKYVYITLGLVAVLLIAGASSTKHFIVDNYKDVVILEPYQVEVCGEVTDPAGDVVSGAIWGAIFGAIVGDVIDDDGGRLPGAIIGAGLGANEEEKKGNTATTSTVCKTETRHNEVRTEEYSHSTISFSYDGKKYELNFVK